MAKGVSAASEEPPNQSRTLRESGQLCLAVAMSSGPGRIRRVIRDLFVGLGWLDRRYTLTNLHLADLCREIYGTDKPTPAQQVSALRVAHAAGAGRVVRTNGRDISALNSGELDASEVGRGRLQGMLARPPLDPGKGFTLLRSASPAAVSRASDSMVGYAKFPVLAFNHADERFKACHLTYHSAISRVDLLHSHLVPLPLGGGFLHTSVRRRGRPSSWVT